VKALSNLPGSARPWPATWPVISPEQDGQTASPMPVNALRSTSRQELCVCHMATLAHRPESRSVRFASGPTHGRASRPTAAGERGAGLLVNCQLWPPYYGPAGPQEAVARRLQLEQTACLAAGRAASASGSAGRRLLGFRLENNQLPSTAGHALLCGLSPSRGGDQ